MGLHGDDDKSMMTVRFLTRPRTDLGGVIEIVPVVDGAELTGLVHAFEVRAGMETRTRRVTHGERRWCLARPNRMLDYSRLVGAWNRQ